MKLYLDSMSATPVAAFLEKLFDIGGADYGHAIAQAGKILQAGIDMVYLDSSIANIKGLDNLA